LFHCVSGFHNQITAWIEQVPEDVHPRAHALETLKPQAITASAGDMVIWHQALPHCATPNYGTSPRMVQYLSYISETYEEAKVWI
jgi:ectoine hydroxylase-related dioxygenase (phytanoyl-CoA dioxygenase family)